jgi:hypothetical protein
MAWSMTQVVEHVCDKCGALNSSPSTTYTPQKS